MRSVVLAGCSGVSLALPLSTELRRSRYSAEASVDGSSVSEVVLDASASASASASAIATISDSMVAFRSLKVSTAAARMVSFTTRMAAMSSSVSITITRRLPSSSLSSVDKTRLVDDVPLIGISLPANRV